MGDTNNALSAMQADMLTNMSTKKQEKTPKPKKKKTKRKMYSMRMG